MSNCLEFVTNFTKSDEELKKSYLQIARIAGVPIIIRDDATTLAGARYSSGLALYVDSKGRSNELINIMKKRFWEYLSKYPSSDRSAIPKLLRTTNMAIPNCEKITPNNQSP